MSHKHKIRYLNGNTEDDFDNPEFMVDLLIQRFPAGVCWLPHLQMSVEVVDLDGFPLDGARLYESDAEMDNDGPELAYPSAVIEVSP